MASCEARARKLVDAMRRGTCTPGVCGREPLERKKLAVRALSCACMHEQGRNAGSGRFSQCCLQRFPHYSLTDV
eukprot:811690-Pelagomonas_calceolata.AAC.4